MTSIVLAPDDAPQPLNRLTGLFAAGKDHRKIRIRNVDSFIKNARSAQHLCEAIGEQLHRPASFMCFRVRRHSFGFDPRSSQELCRLSRRIDGLREHQRPARLCDHRCNTIEHLHLVLRIGERLLAFHDRFEVLPRHEHNGRGIVLAFGEALNGHHELLERSVLQVQLHLQRHTELADCRAGRLIVGAFRVRQSDSDEGDVELGDNPVPESAVVPHLKDDTAEIGVKHRDVRPVWPLVGRCQTKPIFEVRLQSLRE